MENNLEIYYTDEDELLEELGSGLNGYTESEEGKFYL